MKFGTLKSIGHNIADSLACGLGFMIGLYSTDIFGEAASTPEGFIEVDFLTGTSSGGKPSEDLSRALRFYSEALPDFCKRHGADVSDFRQLKVRFSGRHPSPRFTVAIEDQDGRISSDEYRGVPGKRVMVMDSLGRLRPKRSLSKRSRF